jgi:hypothetical protein
VGSRLALQITKRVHSGTPDSSTTKTGRHDIAEILLKVALSTINQKSNQYQSQFVDTENTPPNK